LLLATGLGLGLSPVASGTAGSLLGVVLAAIIAPLSTFWQIVSVLLAIAVAVPVCGAAEARLGKKDDGRIVADEVVTFPLCLLGLPWVAQPWLLAVAFVFHRGFDIVKPPPAGSLQRLKGGLGIVADDVVSSLYALAAGHVVYWAVRVL